MALFPTQLLPATLAAWPLRLEYFSGWMALALWAALGAVVVWLGMRSLSGLGPVRRWVAIGSRLAVLLGFVLILGGVRWQRTHKDVEVMVLRDISQSTLQARDFPGRYASLQEALDDYFKKLADDARKRPQDRIGVISFHSNALIDAMPNTRLLLDAKPIRDSGTGTDVGSALQLALATLGKDAMHRLVLVWDGNATSGDLESAINAAVARKTPIDVLPLKYDIQNEVLMERFISPSWQRENEPFTLDVILKSTNVTDVTGKLTVSHEGEPMDLDPETPGVQATRRVTLRPGSNVERVRVGGLKEPGVHRFHASFDAENVTARVGAGGGGGGLAGAPAQGDTLLANNSQDSFTFVRGRGQVLYVDNVDRDAGKILQQALAAEGINLKRITPAEFPPDAIALINYDAVILANVPRGAGGISDEQGSILAAYVRDMGGGLVMIGGPDAFGAGGWQGSKLEEVLPVAMEIPAQRQIPKGALVLVMHSCEMPDGNYWGIQCALKAAETLSEHDEIGVISYGFGAGNQGVNGAQWDFPLQKKGDGSRVNAAIKKMALGDMPDFNASMTLALNGANPTDYALIRSNAKQKHVIIISDGDPGAPSAPLINQYLAAGVTVSTVSVYPHGGVPDTMKNISQVTRGRWYGPINSNFNQLPQIFIKEATVVRRSLILESDEGIPVRLPPSTSDMVKGLGRVPAVTGMVLTSRKPDPQIEMPMIAGKNADPILAHWRTGLGKAAAFTSDAHNRWAATWVNSPAFGKLWAQVVRGVSRPAMSSDFDVVTRIVGSKGKVTVEAMGKENTALNFLTIRGQIVGPDNQPHEIKLVQTAPGIYTADFNTDAPGNYVVVLNYAGKDRAGVLLSGAAMNASPELRDLRSDEGALLRIAERTGGRVLRLDDPQDADVFRRDGLVVTASPLPVWDIVLPIVLGLILIDVAIRRIAWDWQSTRRAANVAAGYARGFFVTRRVESRGSIDALKRVREDVAETRFKAAPGDRPGPSGGGGGEAGGVTAAAPPSRPDPKAKFQAPRGVEGDLTGVVGGATREAPKPAPAKTPASKPTDVPTGGHTGSLLEAKRRAQQKIKDQEQGQG